jgi:CheY-like chemotaxis protein
LQAEQFDCLLLDFRLPDGDGLELLAEAAATHLRLPPTVLMTTLNDRQTALKALSLGAQDYLVKGEFTQAMLVRAIQYGIQRDQLVQERDRLLRELQAAIENIKTLKGLLPVCSSCKKIRDDSGYWDAVDSYIVKHGLATVSHSLCPTCIRQMYPAMADKIIAATAAEERRTNPSTPG